MKLETVLAKFDLMADTPNSIGTIREVVLQLAVRGHITKQVEEETVSEQQARTEHFRVRRGRTEQTDTEDVPFNIPKNWGWVAVGDAMEMFNGKAFKPEDWSSEGTPIIRIQNLNNENAPFNRCKSDVEPKVHVVDGDFLISWSGTPGTSFGAFIWKRGFAYLNQHIFRCELVEGVFVKEFLRLAVNARLDEMISHAQGAVGLRHITKGKLESIRLPLPPLPEQKRIVAKVDELMALCDRLEAQQEEREMRRVELARASLARFAEAPTPANLNFLFHKSFDIAPADLRTSILTLAVQGKLVRQDLDDMPAKVLLKEIREERAAAVKARRAGPMKPLPPVAFEELAFSLPSGWAVARLVELVVEIQTGPFGSSLHKSDYELGGTPVVNPASLKDGKIVPIDGMAIGERTLRRLAGFKLSHGDIIMARRGEMGRCAIVTEVEEGWLCGTGSLVLRMPRSFYAPYLAMVIGAPEAREYLGGESVGTTMQNLNQSILARMPVGVPPLQEQKRIVAKVEELMALVDQLEAQLTAARETGANLLEAVVAELVA